MRILLFLLLLFSTIAAAQEQEKILYYAKPIERPAYKPPMKPVTRFADLKAKNQGKTSWREPIINDGNSVSFMVQEPSGTKHERRLYPDSAAWFIVLEGRIRFEVEKPDRSFATVEATKGSYVFVPERMLHSFEVMGRRAGDSIRSDLRTRRRHPVFEKRPADAPKGTEYIPVTLSTGPNPLDVRNEGMNDKPWPEPHHYNVYELEKQNASKEGFHAGSDAREPRERELHLRISARDVSDRFRRSRPPSHRYRRVLDHHARRAALGVRRG